jgi:hypothetical protein
MRVAGRNSRRDMVIMVKFDGRMMARGNGSCFRDGAKADGGEATPSDVPAPSPCGTTQLLCCCLISLTGQRINATNTSHSSYT